MDVDAGGTSMSDSEGCDSIPNGNSNSKRDINSSTSCGNGKLKRSSSAPMINQLLPQGSLNIPSSSSANINVNSVRDVYEVAGIQPRARRLSANFGPVSPLSPGSNKALIRMRVCQLRQEEGMDIVNREAKHERTMHSSFLMAESLSQSCEDLALSEDRKSLSCSHSSTLPKKDYSDQLSLTITSSPLSSCGSSNMGCGASPTRVGRQCFSPSLQQHIRNYSFCPSPSPTKRTFTTRRSLSPIPLRPSPLGGIKRKWDQDEAFSTPSKRLSGSTPDRCVGGLLIAHPHSLENTPSPAGPASISSVGTPESVCSSGSPTPTPDPPPHLFKPLSPAPMVSGHSAVTLESSSEGFGAKLPLSSSAGEGSDASSDAMITDDGTSSIPITTSSEMKNYHQAMDLSESYMSSSINLKYS